MTRLTRQIYIFLEYQGISEDMRLGMLRKPLAKQKTVRGNAIARIKDGFSRDDFRRLFRKAAASDFLMGRQPGATWKCPGLRWLVLPENAEKVLEGCYDNHSKANGPGQMSDWDAGTDETSVSEGG